MRELSGSALAVVIALAVYDRRHSGRLINSQSTTFIDDVLRAFAEPRLNPSVIGLTSDGFDPLEVGYKELCAEALIFFEAVAPLVRTLAE
jgi:hypothetical protein